MPKIGDYAALCEAIYTSDLSPGTRVGGWTLGAFESGNSHGMCAGVFSKNQKTVVAFRGTRFASASDFSGDDLIADLQLGVGYNTSYFSLAEQFAALNAPGEGVVFTGHSLGGAIAQTVGNRSRRAFVTFNAPGVALLASQNFASFNPIVGAARLAVGVGTAALTPMQTFRDVRSAFHISRGVNYRLSGDVVSMIGLHYGPIVTVRGEGGPGDQHRITTMIGALGASGHAALDFPT